MSQTMQSQSPEDGAETDLPAHIAVVMDGNGRWAEQRGWPRHLGHREGVKAVKRIIKAGVKRQLKVLSIFAFSSENWQRPSEEVDFLMELFVSALQQEIKELHENQVRVRFIGDRSRFSARLRDAIAAAEALTAQNERLTLVVAANYGGRWDITQAMQSMCADIAAGKLTLAQANEDALAQKLATADLPEPDLLIRTSGEQRISNFMIWQLAYAELYFTETLWPDFDEAAFEQALSAYAQRRRRFGLTSAQVENIRGA